MGVLTTCTAARLPANLRTGVASRGRSPVSVTVTASAASGRVVRATRVASQQRDHLTAYPGEDAPGTGRRVLPPLVEVETASVSSHGEGMLVASAPSSSHRGLSSEECYNRFPAMARASCPLRVEPGPHGGVHLARDDTEGPGSGNRRRPSHPDVEESSTEPLPFFPESPNERRKLVQMRRRYHF